MSASLLCWLFGHKPPIYSEKGWWSPGQEYATITSREVDGIGRVHCTVASECPRCGKNFVLCRVHLPAGDRGFERKKTND